MNVSNIQHYYVTISCSILITCFFWLSGLLAIAFRQTNIVWVLFMAMQAIGPNLMQSIYSKLHENQKVWIFSFYSQNQKRAKLKS